MIFISKIKISFCVQNGTKDRKYVQKRKMNSFTEPPKTRSHKKGKEEKLKIPLCIHSTKRLKLF